jgi:ubiquinone/menaquinone biosynthesis C-methylase UbiE
MQSDDTSYIGKSAYSGDIAANYERDRIGEAIWAREQEWVSRWIDTLPAGGRILDLPVGTGRFTDMLLAQRLYVHASDISDDMLKIAAQRGSSDKGRFSLSRDDVETLPFAENHFDNVISWRLFHLLPPLVARRALGELARVCRGQLVVQFFGVEQCPWWREQVRFWKKLVIGAQRPAEHAVGGSTPWAHIRSYPYTERGLKRLFSQCGLELVESRQLGVYGGLPTCVYVLRKRGSRG